MNNWWWPIGRLVVLGLLVLGACSPVPVSTGPPAAAPTAVPMPTSTAAVPEGAYATQDADRRASILSRATASPFPTAVPVQVQTGQPSLATARRGGLSLEIRLPSDLYLAGEAGQAAVAVRNDGLEPLFVQSASPGLASLSLLDERGQPPDPWPWVPASFPGWRRTFPVELAPGQVLTDTAGFQVPPGISNGPGPGYLLWAEVRFSRPDPGTPRGPDNLWLPLEAGPIPLRIVQPGPSQHLVATLLADHEGWHLSVTDENGRVPPGPLRGYQEITSYGSATAGPLRHSPGGQWSAAWHENEWDPASEICLRAWVAAPGYVTAVATATVPGTSAARCMALAHELPLRQGFSSIEAAQASLAYPLYRPSFLPAGARLEEVRVETTAHEPRGWGDAVLAYGLADGGWLELSQQATAEPYAGFGWGGARYETEARVVAVGGATGYAVQRAGAWLIDWKCGDFGLELRVPVAALSLDELVAIAAGVESPEGSCPPAPAPGPPTASPAPPTLAPPPTPARRGG